MLPFRLLHPDESLRGRGPGPVNLFLGPQFMLWAEAPQHRDMIHITKGISIDENEIHLKFIRASGPGGQKVNKTATAVQLRFDVRNSSLPFDVRNRLIRLAGRRINTDGTMVIDARRFRLQERNRQDAIGRLVELIRKAAERPKVRHKTRPTLKSKNRRLETKRRRSESKRLRRPVGRFDE